MDRITAHQIAGMIDHAILTPNSRLDDVEAASRLCARYQTASICVRPSDVPVAAAILRDSPVKVCTVLGFPHGTTSTAAKVAEAEQAWKDGCQEIDMVLNIGRLLSGDHEYVEHDIAAVTAVARRTGMLIKVIFETFYLDSAQKIAACSICSRVGVDFVKTSTGFAGGGATVDDIHLMRSNCPAHVGIKASGGVRDLDAALAVIACGATRIGTSSTEKIVQEARTREANGELRPMVLEDALARGEQGKTKIY
ncbi:MAG TPA: deoxyribose-phosphate aldolase [Clostridiales bacterium]|nr:deoxyribose-phosphate aldolase [Clostridiales bacterium]